MSIGKGTAIGKQLLGIIEEIEGVRERKKQLNEAEKAIIAEAKAKGFDPKTIRKIITMRAEDVAKRQESETLLDTYMHAMVVDDAPPAAAPRSRADDFAAVEETKVLSRRQSRKSWGKRPMGRRLRWNRQMLVRLLDLRDVQKLTWREIGEAFDMAGPAVCTIYHTRLRPGVLRDRALAEQPLPKRRTPVQPKTAIVALRSPVTPEPRPRYFHAPDTDLVGRIERQGLTAGFFGDPAPGRSALDKQEQRA